MIIESIFLPVFPEQNNVRKTTEADCFPIGCDVSARLIAAQSRSQLHEHQYYELNYVASGSCVFEFEGQSTLMRQGDLCIIAPGSGHDLRIDRTSRVYSVHLRKSTLPCTFQAALARKDTVAMFFNSTLQSCKYPDYLYFQSVHMKNTAILLQNILEEYSRRDAYSNLCCVHWLNLLFSHLMRDGAESIRRYNCQIGSDFALVLQYIQQHYQTVTLSSLAEVFHYSEPHLCTLIRQNCGQTFTEMVKQLRMAEAEKLLTDTTLKINEIAERIGYKSSDHFSRVFRQSYGISPQEFKRTRAAAYTASAL